MPQVHINYLAVLVAAAVAFALGGLWYSPILFAKPWVKAHGFTEERIKEMQSGAARAYLVSFICQMLIALAIAAINSYMNMDPCDDGIDTRRIEDIVDEAFELADRVRRPAV